MEDAATAHNRPVYASVISTFSSLTTPAFRALSAVESIKNDTPSFIVAYFSGKKA
jgi:hypothetical protein